MRLKNVVVKWRYPVPYETIMNNDAVNELGIYYLSRKHGHNETLLYIGKSHNSIYNRLKSHQLWLGQYRGKIFVRVGLIVSPREYDHQLIVDVESALIHESKPIENTDKIHSYTYTYECKIHNTGYRGKLPTVVSMRNHI